MKTGTINKDKKVRTLNFEELNLSESTLNGLKNENINEATSLQQSIISNIGNGQSIVINAASDTEKYTAVAVTALEAKTSRENDEGTAAIVITASADTARTIQEQIILLGSDEDEFVAIDDDGDAEVQAEKLSKQPAVIVANPERLQSLLQEHRFIFRHATLVVLDELDAMVNGDQHENLKRIKRRILSDYTALICTQKFDSGVKKAASSFTDKPVIVGFGNSAGMATPPSIAGHLKQAYINVPYRMKISTLTAHLEQTPSDRCVIFTASKRGTDRLYKVLKKRNLKATSLHGKLSDGKRVQRFSNFAEGNVQFLLVADISAAELDLDDVEQVINYDVPNSSDEYRFRAALLGSDDSARIISLVSKQDRSDISELQNELGQTPEEMPLPEKAKQKLKKRKQSKSSNGQKKKKKKADKPELPRPSYDKLSGGRSGNHDEEETGIVKFFKKLFS